MDEETRRTRIRSHEDLEVWHRALAFAVAVYRATESMPRSEICLDLIERLEFQVQTAHAVELANIVGRQLSALMRSLREP